MNKLISKGWWINIVWTHSFDSSTDASNMLHLATTKDNFINRQNKRKQIWEIILRERGTREWFSRLRTIFERWKINGRNFSQGHEIHILSGGCRNVNGAFQESEGILRVRSAESRSLCRLMHDLASYLAIRHKFSPGADLHNVRSVQRMHEWHAREGMQFVPTLAARFCTNTKKQRVVVSGARHTSRPYGGRVGWSPIGRRKERGDIRESTGKERWRTVDKGALPSSASSNRTWINSILSRPC